MRAPALASLAIFSLVIGCNGSPSPVDPPDFDARPAWDALTAALPGAWSATSDDGHTTHIGYRMISAGSALVETWGAPGHDTMTVLHRDGAGLVATHYCAQGNQPRLRAISGDAHRVVLRYADATNVAPDEAVLDELDFELIDPRRIDRVEVYRQPNGTRERTVWHLAPG